MYSQEEEPLLLSSEDDDSGEGAAAAAASSRVVVFNSGCVSSDFGNDTSMNIVSCRGQIGSRVSKTSELLCVQFPNLTLA